MGIDKRALLEDYYFDEFAMVVEAYAELNSVKREEEKTEEVGAEEW